MLRAGTNEMFEFCTASIPSNEIDNDTHTQHTNDDDVGDCDVNGVGSLFNECDIFAIQLFADETTTTMRVCANSRIEMFVSKHFR